MLGRVYIETTIVSYLTARPSRDVVIAGHQQVTREWWDTRRFDYELCISVLVLDESGAGDSQAAQDRLRVLRPLLILETSPEALELAKELLLAGALPAKAADDALHIAIAASKAIPYLGCDLSPAQFTRRFPSILGRTGRIARLRSSGRPLSRVR